MGRCQIRCSSASMPTKCSDGVQDQKEKGEVRFEEQSLKKQQSMEEEEKKQKLKKKMIQRDGVSVMERVCIGSLAGGIAGGFTNVVLHPIDTVKTKLQTRGASSLYSGPFDVISKVRIISPFFHIINRHGNHHHHHHHFLSTVVIVLSHNNRQGNHRCHMLMIIFTPQWAC